MSKPKPRRQPGLPGAIRHVRGALALVLWLSAPGPSAVLAAEPAATGEKRIDAKPEAKSDGPEAAPTAKPAASKDGAEAKVDFVAVLRELRSAVHEVSTQRAEAQKAGDKVREICLYERQRSLAQALESAEAARVAWETANQASDAAKVRTEQARAQRALELGRGLRSAAESCGGSVPVAAKPTTVTTAGPGLLDDPRPGPSELAKANTVRLELPSRPNPASAFRAAR